MAKKDRIKEKEKKQNQLSLIELDKKLGAMPYTSDEYMKVLEKIRKRERGLYKDQHILCINSLALTKMGMKTLLVDSDGYQVLCEGFKFNDFSDNNTISGFYPRYMIEHDYRYKQVLTFAYVTNKDRTEFLLLRKVDSNRLGMIGGHTDFSMEAYSTKPEDFLIQNLYKELFEEVRIQDLEGNKITKQEELKAEVSIKMIINENDDHYKLRNIGFIYEIKLDVDKFDNHYKFTSGEPSIHDIEQATFKDIQDSNRYHSMLKYIPQIFEAPENFKSNVPMFKRMVSEEKG
jgi:hypothetical protein